MASGSQGNLGLPVSYFPPFAPLSIKLAPPPTNLQLQPVNSFFNQPCPLQYPSVTMVMQGLATALTDAIRDTESVLQDTVFKNVQGSEVL